MGSGVSAHEPGPASISELARQLEEDFYTKARQPVLDALKLLGADNPQERIDEALKALKAIAGPQIKDSIPFRERVNEALEWIDQLATNPPRSVIRFGLPRLDNALLPLEPADQVVLCAETGRGKSALASQAVLSSSEKKFAIFSVEMPWRSLVARMFAGEGQIEFKNLRQGRLSKPERLRLQEAIKRLSGRTIWIEDEPTDVLSIAAKCRRFKHSSGLDAIVVDYLQLVAPAQGGKRDTSREREVAEISRSLKSLALELGIVVIALSQLNDAGQLRESRAIGQDADIVLQICQDEDGASIQVRKHRNGPRCKIPVTFDGTIMRFTEASGQSAKERLVSLPYAKEAGE
jgi:replicative DNA helicase